MSNPTAEKLLWDIANRCDLASQDAHQLMREGSLHTSPTAAEAEITRLRKGIALIEAQDQGCGGNLRPEEIYQAMKRLCRELLQ